jgi:uncharacterized protein
MPNGKPAGVPCVQLDEQLRCKLFGLPERPSVCSGLRPSVEMCGDSREEALQTLTLLEIATAPTADLAPNVQVLKQRSDGSGNFSSNFNASVR